MHAAKDFKTVQKKVAELIKGKILVGHALHNDLKVVIFVWKLTFQIVAIGGMVSECLFLLQVLLLSHPKKDVRDTSEYQPFLRHVCC